MIPRPQWDKQLIYLCITGKQSHLYICFWFCGWHRRAKRVHSSRLWNVSPVWLVKFEACLEGEICSGRGLINAKCALPVCFLEKVAKFEWQALMRQTREPLFDDCQTLIIATWAIYAYVGGCCQAARATGVLLLNSGHGWYFAFCVWHSAQLSIGRSFRWVSSCFKYIYISIYIFASEKTDFSVFWHVDIFHFYHSVSC